MRVDERVLRLLSRPPGSPEATPYGADLEGAELSLLCREFPAFEASFQGKRVVDYGCGTGRQAVAMARAGAAFVCGVDTNMKLLETARGRAAREELGPDRLAFVERVDPALDGTFDLVISQNSMEHYGDPARELGTMRRLLSPRGQVLVTFAPPWLAPYGAHMHFFCPLPWVHLLFRERTVMAVRRLYRDDGAERYEQVESGLNKMTLRRFERLVGASGLRVGYLRHRCVKRQDWLSRLPFLREFFVIRVTCSLSLPSAAAVARGRSRRGSLAAGPPRD